MNGKYYVPTAVLNIPARIWHCKYVRQNGVQKAVYEPDDDVIWLGAKSYGGTEKTVDGVYAVEDTMDFTGYYTPKLLSQDRVQLLGDGSFWEVLNTPENIDMRGAFMKFKGRRYKNA